MHHIGVGRHHHHGTPIIMLIADHDVRVIHATTGEIIIGTVTINPDRRYHPITTPGHHPETTTAKP